MLEDSLEMIPKRIKKPNKLIQRQVTSKFEFGLPSPPWMS